MSSKSKIKVDWYTRGIHNLIIEINDNLLSFIGGIALTVGILIGVQLSIKKLKNYGDWKEKNVWTEPTRNWYNWRCAREIEALRESIL